MEFDSQSGWEYELGDELMERDRLLSESPMNEYGYQGYRWYKGEGNVWLLRRMDFVSNFRKVNFLGRVSPRRRPVCLTHSRARSRPPSLTNRLLPVN